MTAEPSTTGAVTVAADHGHGHDSDPPGSADPVRRDLSGVLIPVGIAIGSILTLLVAVWIFTGVDPVSVLSRFWQGAFGGWSRTASTLSRAIPLVIVGVGAALALRGGVFNVGGEGQMSVGALGAVLVVAAIGADIPAPVTWVLALAAGTLFGAAWAIIPAALWARRGVSEILSTLLINFITASLLLWVLGWGIFADPDPFVITPQGAPIPERARLPVIESSSRLHLGLVVAIALVALAWWFLRTPRGLRLDLVGTNPSLAAQAGIDPRRARVMLLLVSAGAAGIAGTIQLLGVSHRVTTGLSGGIGYTGVLVAVLGRSRPLAVAGAAIAFASVLTGGESLEFAGVPRSVIVVVQATLVVTVAAMGRSALQRAGS